MNTATSADIPNLTVLNTIETSPRTAHGKKAAMQLKYLLTQRPSWLHNSRSKYHIAQTTPMLSVLALASVPAKAFSSTHPLAAGRML